MREFSILNHVFANNARLGNRVTIGPGDDLGEVMLNGTRLLAGVDQLIDGRHFAMEKTPLELVGRKAITRSLSDIAAMAGVPVATLVAATLPPDFGEENAKTLFDSMHATAQIYDCPLIGGDLAFHSDTSHPFICAVTVLAKPLDRAITRDGAKVGDRIFVTGPLGGSLQSDGLGRHLTFEPRIGLGQELARLLGDRLHAMIDISDGLGRDVSHIAMMSDVGIDIKANLIPCNPGCDWRCALGDGEDYELCFAAAGDVPAKVAGLQMHEIGCVAPKPQHGPRVAVMVDDQIVAGEEFGWQHRT